jgi:hypothetical protein
MLYVRLMYMQIAVIMQSVFGACGAVLSTVDMRTLCRMYRKHVLSLL